MDFLFSLGTFHVLSIAFRQTACLSDPEAYPANADIAAVSVLVAVGLGGRRTGFSRSRAVQPSVFWLLLGWLPRGSLLEDLLGRGTPLEDQPLQDSPSLDERT